MKKSGFTLVELLVVIAIIGLLSSIVIGSLNSARTKGNDAVVKAEMASIKPQASLWYDDQSAKSPTGGSYDNGISGTTVKSTCVNSTTGVEGTGMFGDPKILPTLADIRANSASNASVVCSTDTDGEAWAVSTSKLKNAEASWCIDSTGKAISGKLASGGVCTP